MPKTLAGHKRPADVIGNAVRVMQIATGEVQETAGQTDDGKSKAAVELGRRGGLARAAKLTPAKLRRIAKTAALARLTNGFSKKIENHVHMVALYTVFYNWTRVHKTLRTSPAQAAGLTERLWDMADVVALIDSTPLAQSN